MIYLFITVIIGYDQTFHDRKLLGLSLAYPSLHPLQPRPGPGLQDMLSKYMLMTEGTAVRGQGPEDDAVHIRLFKVDQKLTSLSNFTTSD